MCGITSVDQLKELETIGIDYAGLIFYSQSPRYVLKKLNSRDVMNQQLSILKVGVFVNSSEENIMTQVELYGLDLVQLHGDETPSFCNHISNHVKVIKAFRLNEKNGKNIDWMIKPYEEVCDHYLFDTKSLSGFGGSGEKFDWKLLEKNQINKPFFLSGGIGIDDVENIRNFQHPFLFGVDINSCFEVEAGVKDMDLIKNFRDKLNSIKTKQSQTLPDELYNR